MMLTPWPKDADNRSRRIERGGDGWNVAVLHCEFAVYGPGAIFSERGQMVKLLILLGLQNR